MRPSIIDCKIIQARLSERISKIVWWYTEIKLFIFIQHIQLVSLITIKIEFQIVDLLCSIINTTFIFKFTNVDEVKVKNTRLSIVSSLFYHYLIKGKINCQELTKNKRDPFSFYVFFSGNTIFCYRYWDRIITWFKSCTISRY